MVVSGWAHREAEVESSGTTVRLRVVPLTPDGVRTAALVLCRDVTEVRRRERELVGKDATIREIHHRVKNNLQTVAALLRLQSRRLPEGETGAREALREAERRIGSIAVVHETLSQQRSDIVDFDEVADRVVALTGEVSAAGPVEVAARGLLRPAAAGGGHAAGAGARRAGAERRRARVARPGRDRSRRRTPAGRTHRRRCGARGRRRRRRRRAAGGLRRGGGRPRAGDRPDPGRGRAGRDPAPRRGRPRHPRRTSSCPCPAEVAPDVRRGPAECSAGPRRGLRSARRCGPGCGRCGA